jgi:MFS family permease
MLPVVVTLAIDSFGSGVYIPVSLLYFVVVARIPVGTVGLCVSLAAFVSLPLPVLVGMLADRIGPRQVVLLGFLLQAVGFASYLVVREPIGLILAATAVAVGQRGFWSSIFTLVTERSEPERRDHWFGVVGAVQNAGIGVGSLVSAALIAIGSAFAYQLTVALNAVSFLVAIGILALGCRPAVVAADPDAEQSDEGPAILLSRNRPYLALIGINTVFALCVTMLVVGLPVYLQLGLHQPGWVNGLVFAVNTAAIALLQTLVVKVLKGKRRIRIIFVSGLVWAVWSGCLAVAFYVPAFLTVAFVLVLTAAFTTAELMHGPTSMGLAAGASPAGARGRYLGAYQYSFAIANVLAPAMFTQLFSLSPVAPWIVLAVLALAAGIGIRFLEPRMPAASLWT